MCIRDRPHSVLLKRMKLGAKAFGDLITTLDQQGDIQIVSTCLLYTSDAADDLLCVDLGGRRIIKKKQPLTLTRHPTTPHHSPKSHTPT